MSLNLSPKQLSEVACAFETDVMNVWNVQTYNGMSVSVSGSAAVYTSNPNDPDIDRNRQTINIFVGNYPVSSASNGAVFLNYADYNQATQAIVNNTAAHEFGHLWGIADRYLESGFFFSNGGFGNYGYRRVTFPLTDPVSEDINYDYLNNLYSSGAPRLTPYQLNVVFDRKLEKVWNKGMKIGIVNVGPQLINFSDGISLTTQFSSQALAKDTVHLLFSPKFKTTLIMGLSFCLNSELSLIKSPNV